jgi:hypothetical protein
MKTRNVIKELTSHQLIKLEIPIFDIRATRDFNKNRIPRAEYLYRENLERDIEQYVDIHEKFIIYSGNGLSSRKVQVC